MKARWLRALPLLLGLSVVWVGVSVLRRDAAYQAVPAHREAGAGRCDRCHAARVPEWHSEAFQDPGAGMEERALHGREASRRRGTCLQCHRNSFHGQCASCHQPGVGGP